MVAALLSGRESLVEVARQLFCILGFTHDHAPKPTAAGALRCAVTGVCGFQKGLCHVVARASLDHASLGQNNDGVDGAHDAGAM